MLVTYTYIYKSEGAGGILTKLYPRVSLVQVISLANLQVALDIPIFSASTPPSAMWGNITLEYLAWLL